MMIIEKSFKFEAAHQLMEHDGICRNLHGHSYSFTLEVAGQICGEGPKRNMVLDYKDVGTVGNALKDELDHHFLNEVTGETMTTAEFLCLWIYERAAEELPDLWAVRVSETAGTSCRYCPIETRVFELGKTRLQGIRDQLYESVQVGEPDDCWPFLGAKDEQGYGYCSCDEARTNKAHRLAAWLSGRDIVGVVVRHSCDNPPCCNPAHLICGTHLENEQDKDAKGRRPVGEEHYASVLTEQQVRALWSSYCNAGKPKNFASRWAIMLRVSAGVVGNILKGWSWNHVTGLPKRSPRK